MKNELERDSIRIQHMLDAIIEINLFTKGKIRKDLDRDRVLSLALIKEIELIGEAAAKVSENFKQNNPQIPWSMIVAIRNRLIHGYFDIDLDIVWNTIKKDLVELKEMLEQLVK